MSRILTCCLDSGAHGVRVPCSEFVKSLPNAPACLPCCSFIRQGPCYNTCLAFVVVLCGLNFFVTFSPTSFYLFVVSSHVLLPLISEGPWCELCFSYSCGPRAVSSVVIPLLLACIALLFLAMVPCHMLTWFRLHPFAY